MFEENDGRRLFSGVLAIALVCIGFWILLNGLITWYLSWINSPAVAYLSFKGSTDIIEIYTKLSQMVSTPLAGLILMVGAPLVALDYEDGIVRPILWTVGTVCAAIVGFFLLTIPMALVYIGAAAIYLIVSLFVEGETFAAVVALIIFLGLIGAVLGPPTVKGVLIIFIPRS